MKGTALVVLAAWLATSCSAMADDPAVWTKEKIQQLYVDFLKQEGFGPRVDEEGDVVFKKEGRTYFLGVDGDDPHFYRLVYPNFWEIESFEEHLQVLIAADVSNNRSKVSKVYVVQTNTWAAVELFVDSPEDFKAVFYRSIDAVDNGVKNFVNKMRGETP